MRIKTDTAKTDLNKLKWPVGWRTCITSWTLALFLLLAGLTGPSYLAWSQPPILLAASGQSKNTATDTATKTTPPATTAVTNSVTAPCSKGWRLNLKTGKCWKPIRQSTSALATAKQTRGSFGPGDVPCGNKQPRNIKGNCPEMPVCAKRCSWDKSQPTKNQCWTYLGKNVVTGYNNQTVNGLPCAWAFPPPKPDWLKKGG